MKHIKRKTLDEYKLSSEVLENLKPSLINDEGIRQKGYKKLKSNHAFLFHEDGLMTRSFFYKNNDILYTVPLVNPILIYFNEAYKSYKNLLLYRIEFLDLYSRQNVFNKNSVKAFYNFFGATSSFVILLYSSIEAFVNFKIPENYIYSKSESNKFQKLYNNAQIQRWISLDEKIKCILNITEKKSFAKDFPLKQQAIDNLQDYRDSIVHTKKIELYSEYEKLYKTALKFDYDKTIESVKDFINYYESNLIEPCPCNNDY